MRGCWFAMRPLAVLLLVGGAPALAATPQELVGRITAVAAEGKGNAAAAAAWRDLVEAGPPALVPILRAFDDRRLVVVNWLRPAVDVIVERAAKTGTPLPVKELEPFLADRANSALGRALAYELVLKAEPAAADRWLPKFLDDPAPDLRRAGVAKLLADGEKQVNAAVRAAGLVNGIAASVPPGGVFVPPAKRAEVLAVFARAFAAACDPDQVDTCAEQMTALGEKVDVAKKYGFVREWAMTGPFDSAGGKGFAAVFAPEKAIDLAATYEGKDGKKLTWGGYKTANRRGVVDVNAAVGKVKGAAAYAYTVIDSPAERPVEIRVGSIAAVKIWLNGKEVFAHEEYHHGMEVDQYTCRATLKAGKNELLVKTCQNEQRESYADVWMFQLRLSDATGAAVPFAVAAPNVKPIEMKTPATPSDR